jgi:hypothetical protein
MESAVKSRLQSVQLGEPQTRNNIASMPLIAPADGANSPGLPGIYPFFIFTGLGIW